MNTNDNGHASMMTGAEYKAARKGLGLTQRKLAKAIGVFPGTVCKREIEALKISPEMVMAIKYLALARKMEEEEKERPPTTDELIEWATSKGMAVYADGIEAKVTRRYFGPDRNTWAGHTLRDAILEARRSIEG